MDFKYRDRSVLRVTYEQTVFPQVETVSTRESARHLSAHGILGPSDIRQPEVQGSVVPLHLRRNIAHVSPTAMGRSFPPVSEERRLQSSDRW